MSLLLASTAIHWHNAQWERHQIAAVVSAANQMTKPLAQPQVTLVDVQAEQVAAKVVTLDKAGAPPYRQTQVYRLTAGSWQQTALDAAHWGPEQYLESTYFRFIFREHDAQAVHAAAARLDLLYATMRRNEGLSPLPDAGKRVVEVSMARPAGDVLYNEGAHGALVVASPARYRAPIVLTDADLLVQAIVLALSVELSTEVYTVYAIDASWAPLLNALQLCIWKPSLYLKLVYRRMGCIENHDESKFLSPKIGGFTAVCASGYVRKPVVAHLKRCLVVLEFRNASVV